MFGRLVIPAQPPAFQQTRNFPVKFTAWLPAFENQNLRYTLSSSPVCSALRLDPHPWSLTALWDRPPPGTSSPLVSRGRQWEREKEKTGSWCNCHPMLLPHVPTHDATATAACQGHAMSTTATTSTILGRAAPPVNDLSQTFDLRRIQLSVEITYTGMLNFERKVPAVEFPRVKRSRHNIWAAHAWRTVPFLVGIISRGSRVESLIWHGSLHYRAAGALRSSTEAPTLLSVMEMWDTVSSLQHMADPFCCYN